MDMNPLVFQVLRWFRIYLVRH